MKVAIVGAGLAGLTAAKGLLDEGVRDIAIFERGPGPGLETSFANGALLHPSAVDPWNSPGILGHLLKSLGDPRSSVMLRVSALPSLLRGGWGWRFWRESAPARHRAHTLSNVALALHSVKLMQACRDEGLHYGSQIGGSLMTYREPRAFAQAQRWAQMLGEHGVNLRVLGRDEVVAAEPALAPGAAGLCGALHSLSDEAGDAHLFCVALAERLQQRGVTLHWDQAVARLLGDGRGVRGVTLADGREHRADAVVMAAAVWSQTLTAACGLRLPVRPAKGYSVTLPMPPPPARLGMPVIDNTLHVAFVPLAGERLRLAGTAEFCGMDRRVDPARVDNLLQHLREVFPQMSPQLQGVAPQVWTGLRPLCADGKPLIGATKVPGLFLNTGHGQLGWTTAVASGQLLASCLTGQAPAIDPTPFAPSRFGL